MVQTIMATPKLKIDPILEAKLVALLESPRTLSAVHTLIEAFFVEENLNKGQREIVNFYIRENDLLKPLSISWSVKTDKKHIVSTSRSLDTLLLGLSLYPSSYYCFQTSLYCLGITKKMPKINHLAKERPKYGKTNSDFQLTSEIVKAEFQKAAKISKRSATYNGYTFNFFEREFTGKEGIISVQNPITKETQVQTTSLERTLLDIAIAPHHVGGFREACKLWKLIYANSQPDLSQMHAIYEKLNYKYPYWQRIGLILKNEVSPKSAVEWKANFSAPELIFYADREPQKNWDFDSEWNIGFPK